MSKLRTTLYVSPDVLRGANKGKCSLVPVAGYVRCNLIPLKYGVLKAKKTFRYRKISNGTPLAAGDQIKVKLVKVKCRGETRWKTVSPALVGLKNMWTARRPSVSAL